MNKKNKSIICALILFLLGVIGIVKFSFNSGYKIYITNNTNKIIENLELKYKVGNTNIIKVISMKNMWWDI